MSTTTILTEKLDEISLYVQNMYDAIIEKGGYFVSGTELSDFPAAIRTIPAERPVPPVHYVTSIMPNNNATYIELPVVFDSDTKAEIEYELPASWDYSRNVLPIFGNLVGSFTYVCRVLLYTGFGGCYLFDFPDDWGGSDARCRVQYSSVPPTGRKNKITIDGYGRGSHILSIMLNDTYTGAASYSKVTRYPDSRTQYRFRLGWKDIGSEFVAGLKWYSLKWYDYTGDVETLKLDLKPALDPDGVACMYDEVSGSYVYATSGSYSYEE